MHLKYIYIKLYPDITIQFWFSNVQIHKKAENRLFFLIQRGNSHGNNLDFQNLQKMIVINFKSQSTIIRGKYDRNTNPWSYENI